MTVVSNTSPLLNLALIERLRLVESQFGAVSASVHPPRQTKPTL